MAVAAGLALALAGGLYGVESGYLERLALDPAERACDLAVRESLKSPSSYRRLESVVSLDAPKVFLKFDGQNGFGATIRSYAACGFRFEAGLVPGSGWFHLDSLSIDDHDLSHVEFLLATGSVVMAELGSIQADATKLRRPAP